MRSSPGSHQIGVHASPERWSPQCDPATLRQTSARSLRVTRSGATVPSADHAMTSAARRTRPARHAARRSVQAAAAAWPRAARSAASARRRCSSCCGRRAPCARAARVAVAAGARLRRRSSARSSPRCAQGVLARRLASTARARPRSTTCRSCSCVTALLFARSGLYAEREARPGLPRDRRRRCSRSTFVALVFALVNGADFQLLHLLRRPVLRAPLRVGAALALRARDRRSRCAPPATGAGRSSSGPASTSTPSRTRCATRRTTPLEPVGYISLDAAARERAAQPRRARGPAASCSTSTRVDEVIIADPDFPQDEAFELVDRATSAASRVRIAPTTMEIMTHRARARARASRCRCSSSSRRCSRASTSRSSGCSTSSCATLLLIVLSPAAARRSRSPSS